MPNIPFPRDIPFSLQELKNEFDQIVDRVWHVGLKTAPLDGHDWAPAIDVVDAPESYDVRVEVPGLGADDVDVSILDGQLTIRGTKAPPDKPEQDNRYLRRECRYGSFCRRYNLPGPVEEEGVKAACRNGVLEIRIPKKQEARGRSVKVESAE